MADAPETNPKIDSLRAKVSADEKSRHFYPLAEELRKIGQLEEAERVLRAGLEHHSSYLSAWISLGRVLKDRGAYAESIDVLMRGLSLDPENVVAAKLLAHVYLAMGEKVEAIKKFKLVHALMPADEEAEEQIARLEGELSADATGTAAAEPQVDTDAAVVEEHESPHDSTEPPFPIDDDEGESIHQAAEPEVADTGSSAAELSEIGEGFSRETNFDLTNPDPFSLGPPPAEPELPDEERAFGDAELPEESASEAAPQAAMESEEDHFAVAGQEEVEPAPQRAPSSEDVWADEAEEEAGELPESAETVTMAQILVQQGHLERARETYERILAREPHNAEARDGLAALSDSEPAPAASTSRAERLEAWRRKVVRQ